MTYAIVKARAPRFVLPWLDRLERSPLGAKLARGMFWSTLGAVSSRLLALIASIVTARIIGRELFGEFGILQSTITMVSTFATFGTGVAATKHVAEFCKSDPARAGRIIALSSLTGWVTGLLGMTILIVLSPWLATTMLKAPQLSGLLALSALALLFMVVNESQMGTLNGLEAFKRRSSILTIGGLLAFPVTVIGVWYWGLKGAVIGFVSSQAIAVILNARGILQEARKGNVQISWRGLTQELPLLWSFNVPVVLSAAVYVPVMWVGNTILVSTPAGYAEMGVFSAADRWRTAITFLPTLLAGVCLPMLSRLAARSDEAEYKRVLWTNAKINCIAALAFAVPVALAAPWIMGTYGREFAQGGPVLVMLCLSSVILSVYWIAGRSLVSRGRVWTMVQFNSIWAVVFLSSVYLLRAKGAFGLALSYVIADTVRLTLALRLCWQGPLLAPVPAVAGAGALSK